MTTPDAATDMDRRAVLRTLARTAGLAAMAAGAGLRAEEQSPAAFLQLPAGAESDLAADDLLWLRVRAGFALKPGLIHLNSANLAPTSTAVLERMAAITRDVSGDPSFENRARIAPGVEATRTALARLLRVEPDEIAITRNTSEANRTVIAGLELGAGDEVVLWDQNHESNNVAWDVWAERRGFRVARVSVPAEQREPAELLAPFVAALTRKTRLLAFSQVSNTTGVALPAAELCRIAAARGVLTLVDGAQTFGMMELDLHRMGCDFFSGSAHKWLAGPHETGVLYVRAARIAGLWPSLVTHDWELMAGAGARKFECLGQRQIGRVEALALAVGIHEAIGPARIEARIRFLTRHLRERLQDSGRPLDYLTPADAAMSAGIVAFLLDDPDAMAVLSRLYDGYGISAMARPWQGRTLVRFAPNIYNSPAELELAARAVTAPT